LLRELKADEDNERLRIEAPPRAKADIAERDQDVRFW
jgi:hypothetical protein